MSLFYSFIPPFTLSFSNSLPFSLSLLTYSPDSYSAIPLFYLLCWFHFYPWSSLASIYLHSLTHLYLSLYLYLYVTVFCVHSCCLVLYLSTLFSYCVCVVFKWRVYVNISIVCCIYVMRLLFLSAVCCMAVICIIYGFNIVRRPVQRIIKLISYSWYSQLQRFGINFYFYSQFKLSKVNVVKWLIW